MPASPFVAGAQESPCRRGQYDNSNFVWPLLERQHFFEGVTPHHEGVHRRNECLVAEARCLRCGVLGPVKLFDVAVRPRDESVEAGSAVDRTFDGHGIRHNAAQRIKD